MYVNTEETNQDFDFVYKWECISKSRHFTNVVVSNTNSFLNRTYSTSGPNKMTKKFYILYSNIFEHFV